jgi:hypothetical protein
MEWKHISRAVKTSNKGNAAARTCLGSKTRTPVQASMEIFDRSIVIEKELTRFARPRRLHRLVGAPWNTWRIAGRFRWKDILNGILLVWFCSLGISFTMQELVRNRSNQKYKADSMSLPSMSFEEVANCDGIGRNERKIVLSRAKR